MHEYAQKCSKPINSSVPRQIQGPLTGLTSTLRVDHWSIISPTASRNASRLGIAEVNASAEGLIPSDLQSAMHRTRNE